MNRMVTVELVGGPLDGLGITVETNGPLPSTLDISRASGEYAYRLRFFSKSSDGTLPKYDFHGRIGNAERSSR